MATIRTLESLRSMGIDESRLHLYHSHYWNLVQSSSIVPLTPQEEDKFRGDFFSLLIVKKLPTNLFVATMITNGLSSPFAYRGDLSVLKVPSMPLVESIESVYGTKEI